MTRPQWANALKSAFDAVKDNRPLPSVLDVARVLSGGMDLTGAQIATFLETAASDDAALHSARLALLTLDGAPGEELGPDSGTPGSLERRQWLYTSLGLQEAGPVLDRCVPMAGEHVTVIAREFEPWYEQASKERTSTYWDHYSDLLRRKGWSSESIHGLDVSSTEVVRRLSDPMRPETRQTKGLVVGYVQSGKTANFTGVIAKAVDAGYRLVIVLTGTIEILRAQTQRRLDMEIVGRENIMGNRDVDDPNLPQDHDYVQDPAWIADEFVRHGQDLDMPGVPGIERVTTRSADYKRLPDGLTRLKYKLADKRRPLNDPVNLVHSDAYLAVVKKNKAPLEKLVRDLSVLGRDLDGLPVLIIDDESDQASVDTTNPERWRKKGRTDEDRTRINGLISQLMQLCKRAQYVGYTATPFANVFIDPDDDSDLFPSDFLISLPRPKGYMGVREFHDLDGWNDREQNVETSNEEAYIRTLECAREVDPQGWREELRQAMDAFVLSAAIKMYRTANPADPARPRTYRHHTMLIHEAVKTHDHTEAADIARGLWRSGGYVTNTPACRGRLRELFENDYLPVMRARADAQGPVPQTFDDLLPHVVKAAAKISHGSEDPVIVVNSDRDVTARTLDFEKQDMWCILVGGSKLSRGFTVEGLTVSFFRRRSVSGDTMMQAGRWFGFRPGYEDLVRLYIRRDDQVDLYKAFEALMLDEDSFRAELEQYAGMDDQGKPILTPEAVPPLVSQHLPWLRPTARNKMWNATVHSKSTGGRMRDLYNLPARRTPALREDFEQVGLHLLAAAGSRPVRVPYALRGLSSMFEARVGLLDAPAMLSHLKAMQWHPEAVEAVQPWLTFIESATDDARITEWAVVWPQPSKQVQTIDLGGELGEVPVIRRSRRADKSGTAPRNSGGVRTDFVGSDEKHRVAVEPVAQGAPVLGLSASSTRGVVLVYLVDDRSPDQIQDGAPLSRDDLVVLFSIAVPAEAAPSRDLIRWSVRQPTAAGATVPRSGEAPLER